MVVNFVYHLIFSISKMINSILYKPIKTDLAGVERYLVELLQAEETSVSQTIPQILRAGGKRVRPALLLMSAKICKYSGERGIKLATAIELIHTASLIHDDVIDNDTLRRGIPTINSRLGDTISVILGDYIYSMVFNILAENNDIEIIRCVASTTSQMARGDLRQIQNQYKLDLSEEKYLSINADKTASLMSCSCRIGAMLGTNLNGEVETLTRYGRNLGMAFQITDDLLDLTAEEKILGKPLGSDIREGKLTLPLICVMRDGDKKDKEWIGSIFKSRSINSTELTRIRDMVKRYNGLEYSMKKAEEYGNACKQDLQSLESSEPQNSLVQFADFVLNRAC